MISFKFRSILYIRYNFYWVHGNGRSIAFGVCVFLQNKVYLEASDSCTQHSVHVAICIYFLCFVSSSWLWLCCFFVIHLEFFFSFLFWLDTRKKVSPGDLFRFSFGIFFRFWNAYGHLFAERYYLFSYWISSQFHITNLYK